MINNRVVRIAAQILVCTLLMGCGASDEAEPEQHASSKRAVNPGVAVAITLPDGTTAEIGIGPGETRGIISSKEQGVDYEFSVSPGRDDKFAFTVFEADGVSQVETFETASYADAVKTSVPLHFELVTSTQAHAPDSGQPASAKEPKEKPILIPGCCVDCGSTSACGRHVCVCDTCCGV